MFIQEGCKSSLRFIIVSLKFYNCRMKPAEYLREHFLLVSERFVHLKKAVSLGKLHFFCNGSQIGSLKFFCENDGTEFRSVGTKVRERHFLKLPLFQVFGKWGVWDSCYKAQCKWFFLRHWSIATLRIGRLMWTIGFN